MKKNPVALIILDGWGIAPSGEGNAITRAKLPFFNSLIQKYPATALHASGQEVGLPWGTVGNSEVGHLNIGSGTVCYQTLPRINRSIDDGTFFENKVFLDAAAHAKNNQSALHLIGLASHGGVHSHIEHLYALLEIVKKQKIKNVYLHLFLDGRDTLFNAGLDSVRQLEEKIKKLKVGKIASISGRFYAMDRDSRWDRTESVYRLLTEGRGEKAKDAISAIENSYANKIYDEEFVPTAINLRGEPFVIKDNDAVIFFNFRPDRARQLTKAFVLPQFQGFARTQLQNLYFAGMAEFEKGLSVAAAFEPQVINMPLAKYISGLGKTQLHIAETEKYAHVTFFLNGMIEDTFPGEERIIVPSLGIASYDQKPEMSAGEVTRRVIKEINAQKHDFIALNFANSDIVGHTGSVDASIKAVETVDRNLKQIIDFILAKDGAAIITADHGNAEELINLQTGEIDKEHSTNPVPFILIHKDLENQHPFPEIPEGDLSLVKPTGILADIAPTALKFLGAKVPPDMVGNSLI